MNVLKKFTIKSLKLNKKRTITTIIGIMLSTALICGVAGLVSSFQNTLIEWTKAEKGNYHIEFKEVEKDKIKYITENQKVKQFFTTHELGWANLEGSKNENKPYLHIIEYDKNALENYDMNLIEGRAPQNSNELVISEHILTNARVNLKLGEQINIDVGQRILDDGTILNKENPYLTGEENEDGTINKESIINTNKKTYTIVGIMSRSHNEGYSEPGYTCITYNEAISENTNIFVEYKNPKEYEQISKNILENINKEKEDVEVNEELLRYQGVMSYGALNALYTIAAIILIIIITSSVFVIRNSFSISVSEKNKQYGMLSSIGATSKQIKKSVIFEGMSIAVIAIPLGIIFGIIAIIILLQIVNYLLIDVLNNMQFIYRIEPISIIISIFTSLLTIYLSCLIPAKRAAKISPIVSIRGNNDINIKSKKLKVSKITKKIFGIGGVIASKNLKRSRKKYRTTVISIVVSIFIFISLSTFLNVGIESSAVYYTDYKFNMYVSNGTEEIYKELAKLDNVDDYAYYYTKGGGNIDFEKYYTDFGREYMSNRKSNAGIAMIIYNNEYFKEYIKELGINENDYNKSVIMIDDMISFNEDGVKTLKRIFNIKEGETIKTTIAEKEKNLTITKCTTYRPMGLEATYYGDAEIIVSKDFVKEVLNLEINDEYYLEELYIKSNKSQELENVINDLIKEEVKYQELEVNNFDTYVSQTQRMILVIKIFLYGFIAVITLIGVTNIFNTITTNMVLRSKEFAMLKSIGMTSKEFNRMIRLESIMYGVKSLLIGIPCGLIGSYSIYKGFANMIDVGYAFPVFPITISIVFVFIIVGITMRYSLKKINKQNIIETIREDNI